jgi:hypothetical protein
LAGCPGENSGSDGGKGGGSGGGGGTSNGFTLVDLDPAAREATYFAMAVDPDGERVGIAYYTPRGTETVQGHPDYNLNYVEWKKGQISPIETIRFVQRKVGLSVQFHPTSGEPTVAHLGGAPGFIEGESIFWFQSDATYSTRQAGVWTENSVATTGAQVACGNNVSDRGFLVGLWPAIAYDSTGKLYFAYRDCHDGQFPMQDWQPADVEVWEGSTGALAGTCVLSGGKTKQGAGGHIQFVKGAGDELSLIYDRIVGTADGRGSDVLIQQRRTDGTWTAPQLLLTISDTQTGPNIAYDSVEGYGITVTDRSTGVLSYINSADGRTWSAPSEVFGSGSGGWYPSLAIDPTRNEPVIAYHNCSTKNGVNETSCSTNDDELVISRRLGTNWRETSVDKRGGYTPKIGFFKSGRSVIVYRQPPAIDQATGTKIVDEGALRMAIGP